MLDTHNPPLPTINRKEDGFRWRGGNGVSPGDRTIGLYRPEGVRKEGVGWKEGSESRTLEFHVVVGLVVGG